ncbi:uncharacterized protein LOC132604359 [Lycium barbarum]|uniref:uncharacterized protein LOC132604359 n=1 Tax=Lycium barbarum TaxID=112863 RepID=UPI00293E3050|nr:uncharacterized protein LOC132604359 [Lycium barbarum]
MEEDSALSHSLLLIIQSSEINMANKCFSPTLAILLIVLLVGVSVQVKSLRNLPQDIQMLEQIVLSANTNQLFPHCGMSCRTNNDCKNLRFCFKCGHNILHQLVCVWSV